MIGKKNIILTFILLFIASLTYGQSQKKCEKIYDVAEKMPEYYKNETGIMNYISEKLFPIIKKYNDKDGSLISNLYIKLTIDKNGKVIDATFIKPYLTTECKIELKKKLLEMKGWKPAQIKGQNVCAYYLIPISCIKWQ